MIYYILIITGYNTGDIIVIEKHGTYYHSYMDNIIE